MDWGQFATILVQACIVIVILFVLAAAVAGIVQAIRKK